MKYLVNVNLSKANTSRRVSHDKSVVVYGCTGCSIFGSEHRIFCMFKVI